MTLRKSICLFVGLSMIAIWVGCSSSSSAPTIAISATAGTPQSVEVGTAFAALQATVTSNGSPSSGASVTFTVNPAANGATCTFPNTTGTETDTTNSSGQANSSPCTANSTAGSFTVTASTSGTTSTATFNLTSTPVPINVTVVSGNNQSATVGTQFANDLEANVTTNGTATSGVNVVFTIVPGANGASATFSNGTATETDLTDANGNATTVAPPTANTVAGGFTVTATYSGVTATFNESNTSGTPANLTATSGTPQSVAVSTTAAPLVATVTDADGNPVQGVQVTFTAPATAPSGTFTSTTNNVEVDATDANGNATANDFVADSTVGGPYNVVATSGTLTPVNFSITNTAVVTPAYLGAGNYVFYVSGFDSNGNGYEYMGVFVASGSVSGGVEAITGGEQDFSDSELDGEFAAFITAEPITGGTITQSPDVGSGDTNLIITLNFTDSYINNGAGTTTLNASMASSTEGLISEYDSWASGTGELKFQDFTPVAGNPLCATTPCGYVFVAGGLDGTLVYGATNGGVIVVDGAEGSISGNGSVLDDNDTCGTTNASGACEGAAYPGLTVSASSVTAMDQFGLVTFTIQSPDATANPILVYDGYAADPTHIYLIERWDVDTFEGTTGGTARGQTSVGTFADSSVDGSTYVVSMTGYDNTAGNYLTVAGAISFSSGNLGGNVSFNDLSFQSPQGGEAVTAGTYTVSSTGDFTLSGITDTAGDYFYDLQLYLTGDGHALVMSMDAANTNADTLGGLGKAQATGLTSASLSGSYALALGQDQDGATVDGDGVVSASSGTISGFLDQNKTFVGKGLVADKALSATYPSSTSGIIDLTPSGGGLLTIYLVDTTQGVVIENDDSELTLGSFVNQ